MAWPTTNDPRTEFVTLRLTKSEAADLDAYAKAKRMKRSAAVRSCVDRVIAAEARRNAQQKAPSTARPGGRVAERTNEEDA